MADESLNHDEKLVEAGKTATNVSRKTDSTTSAKQSIISAEKMLNTTGSESDQSETAGGKSQNYKLLKKESTEDSKKALNIDIPYEVVKPTENLYNALQQKAHNVMKLITDKKSEPSRINEEAIYQVPSANKVNNQPPVAKKSNESNHSRISVSSHQSNRSLTERKSSSTKQNTVNDSRKGNKIGILKGSEYQAPPPVKSTQEKANSHLLRRQCAIKPETVSDSESQQAITPQIIENEAVNTANRGGNQIEKNLPDTEQKCFADNEKKNSPDVAKDTPDTEKIFPDNTQKLNDDCLSTGKFTNSQDNIYGNTTPTKDDQRKTFILNDTCDKKLPGRKLDRCCRKSDNYQEVCEESTQAVFKELSQIIQANQVPEQLTKKGEIISNLFKQKLLAKLEASGNLDSKSTELATTTAARFAKWVEDILIETDNRRKHSVKDNSAKLTANESKQIKEDNDDDEFVSASSSKESFTHKEDLTASDHKVDKPEVVKIHEVSDLELKEKFGPMLEDKSKFELFNFIGPDQKPVEVKHLLTVESNIKVMIVKKTISNSQYSNWIVEVGPDVKLDDVTGFQWAEPFYCLAV